MSKEYLPLKIDPFRLADHATCVQGNLPIKNMQRLVSSLSHDDATVDVRINFGKDEQGIRFAKGSLSTHLPVVCQRCMEPFSYEIISDLALAIVQTAEEANHLPGYYDPLVVTGPDLYIQDIIEDELIIHLPIVPMHGPDECKVKLPVGASSDILCDRKTEKDNPFKMIELLRNRCNKIE